MNVSDLSTRNLEGAKGLPQDERVGTRNPGCTKASSSSLCRDALLASTDVDITLWLPSWRYCDYFSLYQAVLSSNESTVKRRTSNETGYGKDKDQSKHTLSEIT